MLVKGCSFYQAKHFLVEWNRGSVRKDLKATMPKAEPSNPDGETSQKIKYTPFRKELSGLQVGGIRKDERDCNESSGIQRTGVGTVYYIRRM